MIDMLDEADRSAIKTYDRILLVDLPIPNPV